jgi:RimJ/RimL family protein N-acetyltransferase
VVNPDADRAGSCRRSGESRRSSQATVGAKDGVNRVVIETRRLRLVPATVALARAEIGDRSEFARLLNASVPDNWPPETAADALPLFLDWLEAAPDAVGWFSWYALAADGASATPILVAGGGFLGPPQDLTVRIGYSVLPEFQGRGYATEMVTGLVRWAMEQPGVARIVAETEWANPASARVLIKAGFVEGREATEPCGARFEFHRGARSAEPGAAPDRRSSLDRGGTSS